MNPTPLAPSRRRNRLRVLGTAAVLLAATVSCGDDGGDDAVDVEVRPFAEVQDGDIVVEADPNDPTRAIARVTTTEPMICAIVWGEDESFGRFNNSLAMDGTGIIDHDVVLPDVEPGVTYSFVAQGTTADGTLYRSEVLTFTLDPDDVAPAPDAPDIALGENLAPAATVAEVSSEFSEAFGAEHAIDDDPGTEWASAGDGDEGYIVVDLGAEHEIAAVELVTRSMADGSSVTEQYTFTVDDDEPLGPFPAGTPAQPRVAEVDVEGRELRFDLTETTGGNTGVVEIRIYAPPR